MSKKTEELTLTDKTVKVKYSQHFPQGTTLFGLIFSISNLPVEGLSVTGIRTRGKIIDKIEKTEEIKVQPKMSEKIKSLIQERDGLLARIKAIDLQLEGTQKLGKIKLNNEEISELSILIKKITNPSVSPPLHLQNNDILNELENLLKNFEDYKG